MANQNLSDTAYIHYADTGSCGGYKATATSDGDGITYTVGKDDDKIRLAQSLKRKGYRKVVDAT